MTALFKTEENVNAEKANHFDELLRYGAVSVEGIATRSINPHAENIDPHSSTAYAGLSIRSKVGKRKSRVSRKVPIKVFSADSTNFMAMVHKLTGFQSSAYLLPGFPQTSLLKPVPNRPLHSFTQGMYMPDSPAGDKTTANFSNDSFSSALLQRKSSLSGRQQLDSINDVSLSTKESFSTLHSPSSANRFPPYVHNPAFEALRSQILRNSNSWGSSSGTAFLPSQGDPMKEDCEKEESCMDWFSEQRMLHDDISSVNN